MSLVRQDLSGVFWENSFSTKKPSLDQRLGQLGTWPRRYGVADIKAKTMKSGSNHFHRSVYDSREAEHCGDVGNRDFPAELVALTLS